MLQCRRQTASASLYSSPAVEEIAEDVCKQPSMKPILLGGSTLIKIRGTDAGITSS